MENPFVIYSFHRDEAGAMDDLVLLRKNLLKQQLVNCLQNM